MGISISLWGELIVYHLSSLPACFFVAFFVVVVVGTVTIVAHALTHMHTHTNACMHAWNQSSQTCACGGVVGFFLFI